MQYEKWLWKTSRDFREWSVGTVAALLLCASISQQYLPHWKAPLQLNPPSGPLYAFFLAGSVGWAIISLIVLLSQPDKRQALLCSLYYGFFAALAALYLTLGGAARRAFVVVCGTIAGAAIVVHVLRAMRRGAGRRQAQVHYERARTAFAERSLNEALTQVDHSLSLDPEFALGFAARALVRSQIGDLEGAWADAERAIKLDSECALAFGVRGQLRRERKQIQAAIADLTRAIALDPTDATSYRDRAGALEAVGRIDEARNDVARAAELEASARQGRSGRTS